MMSLTIKQCLRGGGDVSEGVTGGRFWIKNHRFASITHHCGFSYSTMCKDKEEDYPGLVGAVTAQRGASEWKVGAFLH